MMRVALVTNFCPHYRRPLFSELSRRMDLTLILTSRGNEWYWEGERPLDSDGVPAIRARHPLRVAYELKRGGYDAVIVSLTGRGTLLAAVAAARALRVPLVLWVGIWEHPRTLVHRFSHPVVRWLYRTADAVLTYGSHVSAHVERESGRKGDVFVAKQAVENERLRAPVSKAELKVMRDRFNLDGLPMFAFVGRVTEEKGLEYLIDASARVSTPHKILIGGSGPLLEATRERTLALGIDGRVCFAGRVEQADLPAFLQASDALVLPSVSTSRVQEAWGLVVNEAMNCGLPVVVTDAVGAAAGGLVKHGETGFVVPQRDADGLATVLAALARDGAMRERMGEAARSRVLAWNYTAAADAFEAALAAAATRRSR